MHLSKLYSDSHTYFRKDSVPVGWTFRFISVRRALGFVPVGWSLGLIPVRWSFWLIPVWWSLGLIPIWWTFWLIIVSHVSFSCLGMYAY